MSDIDWCAANRFILLIFLMKELASYCLGRPAGRRLKRCESLSTKKSDQSVCLIKELKTSHKIQKVTGVAFGVLDEQAHICQWQYSSAEHQL